MQTEAVFENIADRILSEISKAENSIFIAVAWITNKTLFEELVIKARSGCSVSLIISNDKINQNTVIDFDRLNFLNSKVYWVGNGGEILMHHKFCIIDFSTIITGSYNWSYKAESNFENVIITIDDTALAEQFISEFYNIIKRDYPHDNRQEDVFPLNRIIKRLEILKNYIILEDVDDIDKETSKLKSYNFNSDINEIISVLKKQQFTDAIRRIDDFISRNNQILAWIDPEIAALKLEIKNLENQLNSYDNERIELEKKLSEFQHRHSIELGEIILEILRLRKIKFQADKSKYEEAENDEKQYREQFEIDKGKKLFELTEEQKSEIKKKFRKASVLCHPDKVSDEFEKAASKIFIELRAAYETNDLEKVSEILDKLEKGHFFKSKSETMNEKDLLMVAVAKLRQQVKNLETQITLIKQSEAYKTIINIDDWDDYFKRTKEKLVIEFEELKKR